MCIYIYIYCVVCIYIYIYLYQFDSCMCHFTGRYLGALLKCYGQKNRQGPRRHFRDGLGRPLHLQQMTLSPLSHAAAAPEVLWMVARSASRTTVLKRFLMLPQRKYQQVASHGFKVVRNGFRPSTVCQWERVCTPKNKIARQRNLSIQRIGDKAKHVAFPTSAFEASPA